MTDLVARLRACADHPRMIYPAAVPIVLKAADALEQSTLEIKEYREALSWQPIETAPKDGSRVIVWNERYAAPVSAEMNGTLWAVHGYKLNIQPTHWMPLPKPPSRAALNHHEGSEG